MQFVDLAVDVAGPLQDTHGQGLELAHRQFRPLQRGVQATAEQARFGDPQLGAGGADPEMPAGQSQAGVAEDDAGFTLAVAAGA